MPSVMQTTRGISASMASWIPPAARGGLFHQVSDRIVSYLSIFPLFLFPRVAVPYGTKIPVAVAPVSLTASVTFAKTGRSRCVLPAFLGFVPPTTFVPANTALSASFSPEQCCLQHEIGYRCLFTVCDGLLSVEPVVATRWLACETLPRIFHSKLGCCQEVCELCSNNTTDTMGDVTHVPCFPVKPWKMTLVSPLTLRFSMVCW